MEGKSPENLDSGTASAPSEVQPHAAYPQDTLCC